MEGKGREEKKEEKRGNFDVFHKDFVVYLV